MKITAKTKICMTIGDPIEHSLSPQMHNAGIEAAGLDGQYVYVAGHVKVSDIPDFLKGVRAMRIHFISCTVPHKQEVMQYLDEIDAIAQKIGAVNTIVNENGVLKGFNTDWLGVVTAIEKLTSLENKTVALLGAGGAARAVAYAVASRKAKLVVYNRTLAKAEALAKEFGGEAFSFETLDQIKNADIIINATVLGMHPKENETPITKDLMSKNQIVFDLAYTAKGTTKLLDEAKEQGAQIITGKEMLVCQAVMQFKLYTGHEAPIEAMRKAII